MRRLCREIQILRKS